MAFNLASKLRKSTLTPWASCAKVKTPEKKLLVGGKSTLLCLFRGKPLRASALSVSQFVAVRKKRTTLKVNAFGIETPIVSGSDYWGMWTVLLISASGGFWSERYYIGKQLSGPLVATLLGLLASNVGIIPSYSPVFSIVNKYLLPLAIPLLLFGADLRRVLKDTGKLLVAFLLGSVATIIGTLVAFWILPLRSLGSDSWKIAAALMARHIGGAVNYVAVSEALQSSSYVVTAGMAADNLICAIYFTSLFALAAGLEPDKDATSSNGYEPSPESDSQVVLSPLSLSLALSASAILCTAGNLLVEYFEIPGGSLPVITAAVVLLATVFPKQVGKLSGPGEVLAAVLLQIFFATVGANGSIASVINTAPSLFLFSFIQIAVHLAIILGVGKVLGLGRKEILLASNANVGGPTTGAGMATAKGWKSLVVPTILVGILGYAIATFLSIGIGYTVLRHM